MLFADAELLVKTAKLYMWKALREWQSFHCQDGCCTQAKWQMSHLFNGQNCKNDIPEVYMRVGSSSS